jgi:hypothetical protein
VTPKVAISSELAEFLESGLSVILATRDSELQPDGAAAYAVRVHDDGTRLSVYLHEEAADRMLRNLKAHPEIAIDLDLPTSHRACQVKGVYVSSRAAREPERALIDRQVEGFAADLEEIGIPRAMTAGWQAWPCAVLEVRVTELYEQTPGPGAGEPLR